MVVGMCSARRTRFRSHRPVARVRTARRPVGGAGPATTPLRDELSRALRGRRCSGRFHQTGGGRRRRRIGGRQRGPRVPCVRALTYRQAPMSALYPYSFDKRLVAFWGVFGVRPAKDGVTLTDDGRLRATFGLL